MKKLKGITALIVLMSFLSSNLTSFAATSETTPVVNESFNSYVTYDKPGALSVTGFRYYIDEYQTDDKGLKFELSGAAQKITFKSPATGNYYISFDCVNGGSFDGTLKVNTGSEKTLLKFSDSQIATHNGLELFGVGTTKKNIGVAVNVNAKSYTVYENGKAKISDFYDATISSLDLISFSLEFSSAVVGSVLVLDNVFCIEGGYTDSSRYPKAAFSDKTTDKPEFVKNITEEAYLSVDFEAGKRVNASFQGKGNVCETKVLGDGNSVAFMQKINSSDLYVDVETSNYESDVVVYEMDLYLMNDTSYSHQNLGDSARQFVDLFKLQGKNIVPGDGSKYAISVGEWVNVAVVVDKVECLKTVYVNDKKIAENISINNKFTFANTTEMRVQINGSQTGDNIMFDNVKVYGGSEPREIGEVEQVKASLESGGTVFASEAEQKSFMKGKVGVHTRSGVLYAKDKKTVLEDKPFIENGRTLVPVRAISEAFDIDVDYDEATGVITVGDSAEFSAERNVITIDGEEIELDVPVRLVHSRAYLPLRALCEQVLGKTVLYDNTAVSGGMIVIGDGDISLPEDEDELKKLNDFLLYERPDTQTVLEAIESSPLKGVHPRILATDDDFARIRELCETDKRMIRWKKNLLQTADGMLGDPAYEYVIGDGVRLSPAWSMIPAISVCAMAYQLTGDERYAEQAYVQLEAGASWQGWHPEHTLDTAAVGIGMALGYDWLYNWLTPERREIIEKGMYDNGINDYILGYQNKKASMVRGITATNNWGPTVNAGGAVIALALSDLWPEEAAYIVANSVRGIEEPLVHYAPNGSWYEGIGYSCMTQEYLAYHFAVMDEILGTVYSVDKAEGLSSSARAILYMQSPLGTYAYLDSASVSVQYDAAMFYLAEYYNDSGVVGSWFEGFDSDPQNDDLVRTMLWYKPESAETTADMMLDIYNPGEEVVTGRDQWAETIRTFVGMKGGTPNMAHGHMDIGDFCFYANGAMWTSYVGSENYNLPGFWEYHDDSLRWTYYGLRAEAKNTLVINPDESGGFESNSMATFTRYESKPRGMIGILDMSESHGADKVSEATRAYFLTDNRRSFVVRDEVTLKNESELYWFLQTEQDVKVEGNRVILSRRTNPTNKVAIDFACSDPIEISVGVSEPLATSPKPEGLSDKSKFKRIIVKMKADGAASITAKFTPTDVLGDDVSKYDVSAEEWVIPDGELPEVPILDRLTINGIEYDVNQKNISYFYKASKEHTPPQIVAESSRYSVDTDFASELTGTSKITLFGENGSTAVYTVEFHEIPEVKIDGYVEADIANVSASAIPQLENGVENVLDRDMGTRWSAEGLQYIVVDMGKETDFSAVAMAFYSGNGRKYTLDICVSNDGENFTNVYTGSSSGTTNDYECFAFAPQNARYIKISGNGSDSNGWNSWTEVAVMTAG